MDTEQYYPTPASLAERMWDLFETPYMGEDAFILEPSAGSGSLIKNMKCRRRGWSRKKSVDVCEINPERLDLLGKTDDVNVVGHDFLQFQPVKQYSHIIMNPPFHVGVKHLCHAWKLLQNGEIVCLLNANAVKNPHASDEFFLPELIEQHGSVEYIQDAFISADTQRKTCVEVALIHLKKETPVSYDYFGGLALDKDNVDFDVSTRAEVTALAIPENVIQNAVRVYGQARQLLQRRIEAQCVLNAEYSKIAGILGGSLLESEEEKKKRHRQQAQARFDLRNIQKLYNEEAEDLKERAWHYVLTGIQFYKELSRKAQKHFDSEFKKVRKLEFTEANIHGFLAGVALNRSAMNDDMMLEMFDRFVERHPDNRAYYRAWKSNAKHRSGAWRIKYTRIILPMWCTSQWSDTLDYDAERALLDIDKSFAQLEAKQVGDIYGLAKAARACDLSCSERYDSEYFEWRYYKGAKTIHLYPKRPDLIERLNRTVGRLRHWLPPEEGEAGPDFWRQYAEAEKVSHAMQINQKGIEWREDNHDNPLYMERVEQAHAAACKALKIPLVKLLPEAKTAEPEKPDSPVMALPAAPAAGNNKPQLALI